MVSEIADDSLITETEELVRAHALRGERYDSGWRFKFAYPEEVQRASVDPVDDERMGDAPIVQPAVGAPQDSGADAGDKADDTGDEALTDASTAQKNLLRQIECAVFNEEVRPLEDAPSISAAFLRRLLLGLDLEPGEAIHAIDLCGVRITGAFSIKHGRLAGGGPLPALIFSNCCFDEAVIAESAHIERLDFWHCFLPSFNAAFLSVAGPLGFYDSVITSHDTPKVSLEWAQIGGALEASKIQSRPGIRDLVIDLLQANLRGIFNIRNTGDRNDDNSSVIELNIWESTFKTSVNLEGSVFSIINAENCHVEENFDLTSVMVIQEIKFNRAKIGSDLRCDHLKLHDSADGFGLVASHISGAILMRNATIFGCIEMMLCQIDKGWELDGSQITARMIDGYAIAAREAKFGGSVWMRSRGDTQFLSSGLLDLRRVRIEGDLLFHGAHCRRLPGGAPEAVPKRREDCLDARGIHVAGDLQLGKRGRESIFEGPVRIDRVNVGGDLVLTGASFIGVEPPEAMLTLRDGNVEGHLRARDFADESVTKGVIDLTGLHVGVLNDKDGQGWGKRVWRGCRWHFNVRLRLNGFTYGRLDNKRNSAPLWKLRKQWLRRQDLRSEGRSVFHSQPYEQLARALRADGWEEDARKIAVLKRTERRKSNQLQPLAKLISALYHLSFGYGLSPLRATMTLLLYWGLGIVGLSFAKYQDQIVRVSETGDIIKHCQPFSPGLHALRTIYPLSNIDTGKCIVDPSQTIWKAAELGYGIIGTILIALAVVTFSGVTRNEFNR